MLDLNQLARQMQGISQHLVEESVALRQRLNRAEELMKSAEKVQTELVDRQTEWHDRFIFTAATPIEPLGTHKAIGPAPSAHTVIATDGSQISPSHHEIAYCYLLNIGRIILHYGQSKLPLLDSQPEVFYRPEDLYVSRQWGVRTEEWMGYCRTAAEVTVLGELAEAIAPTTAAPIIAMTDGSLLHWFLEPLPKEARDRILKPILESWKQMRKLQVPMVGYISASRSGEATNFLRLHTCPYIAPDCLTHCSDLPNKAPCQVLDPLRDAGIWGRLLEPGERSPLWRSSAKIQDFYGKDYEIHFCYVNVGAEIARVEVPAWVAVDESILAMTLSLVIAQVQKGYGYPVALAEAHNQAVVRGGDRARFFALLEREMVKAGLRNVGTSYKEARKRGSIA
ncbi:DNA double-strand break repair nuclease NurA [filamentous cyanobacterium LEGE 11480]|uniref:DNA double-strand break repair nuclease NurA n=1 Tax=Romeriopsis navalis LEGE 11480 TaxID=2777977 RepID=A0A928VPN7_9CYAN|nr:DNA double-strand break repair nuclease NurA [Romeriopsis navalis]MBE9029834.1 DNA double-strand break repair nuclease NurA [Romeriopsis navalis LEGE 11480]